ncbi:VOC family protein [Sphingomonas sp. 22176]|uniref:VOC family protein n=1 Tax=Sphingomonas sp. 22176 TaxID=3453884 RepID=UPI003F827C79
MARTSSLSEDVMPVFSADRWGRPRATLVARLHYLEIGCADPQVSAVFYQQAMGNSVRAIADGFLASAPDRMLMLSRGKPRSLLSAGFALPDAEELDRLRRRLDAAGNPYDDGTTWCFAEAVAVRDPDGNRFVFGVADSANDILPPATVPPARLQHVVLASRAPERITRFFIDVLGFTLSDDVLDDQGGVRTSFLRCSDEHHSFAVFLAGEDRFDHHCYETTDWNAIRDWADHLAALHIPIQWGPGRHGPGNNLFLFVHDPDGNWVEISAELEIVRHDRPVGQWPHVQRTLNSWGQGLLRS